MKIIAKELGENVSDKFKIYAKLYRMIGKSLI
jgi:hypothetical protein